MGTFYQRIGASFGFGVVADMKAYTNTNRKLAAFLNRRIFLHECRRKNLTPKFMEDNLRSLWRIPQHITKYNINQIECLTKQVTKKFSNINIVDTNFQIKRLKNLQNKLIQKLRDSLPFNIFDDFMFIQHSTFNKQFEKCKTTNLNKIKKLEHKYNDFNVNSEGWFINLSSIAIPRNVKNFLALGPKFSLPVLNKDINIFNLLAEVEHLIQFTPSDRHDWIRARATSYMTNFINSHKNAISPTLQLEKETRKFLKDHPDLFITRSDKGNVGVLMSADSYLQKSYELLNDTETYQKINSNPSNKLELSCNKLIRKLKDMKLVDESTAKNLTTYNGTCPKYYGLPKVHKTENPLRPIISCTGASTQPLSRFIGDVLSRSFEAFNKFRIKNTFVFAEQINDFNLEEGFVLASFDVVSLFTNIPLNLIVSILDEHFTLISDNCNINKDIFIEVITYLYSNTYFSFNGEYYKQNTGVPMGGSCSPIIADIVMNYLLRYVVDNVNFQFPIIYQYVDDLLVALPHDKVNYTLNMFNGFNNKLQFTVEEEDNRSVPFLDTKVVRDNDNCIKLDWYRKKSASGRYIPFYSYHPVKHKLNMIKALLDRIEKICHRSFKDKNRQLLLNILTDNGYPLSLLKKIFHNNTRSKSHSNNTVQSNNEIKYGKLQYIHGLSQAIASLFKDTNVKIANYNIKKMNIFYTTKKDKTDNLQKSNLVYGIKCECGLVYIGQTSQKLSKRIALHKSDAVKKPNATSLSIHVNKYDHRVWYSESFILSNEKNWFKRNFLEMCFIHNCGNSINQKKDVQGLSNIYTYLLTQSLTKNLKLNEAFKEVNWNFPTT